MLKSAISVVLVLALGGQDAAMPKGRLVVVGGGSMPDEVWRKMVDLAGGKGAVAVVLPYASELPKAGQSDVKRLEDLGVARASIPPLDDPKALVEAIRKADLVWMPGGDQSRLMRALGKAEGAGEAIRERFRAGAVVGGTSAGAAVMSKTMIAGGSGERVEIGDGLALWPEAVVDQHFLKRNRQDRLRVAIGKHPGLVGVGIDESTAVLVGPAGCEVLGRSKVVLMDGRKGGDPKVRELETGATFDLRKE